ncbi:MAG: elongation factor G [Spirochaetaceae bacterium]|nr:MAG: elongation factor G [Spirochaetaceae bacterium]
MASGNKKMRNLGISAHIDAGKTTLTERILYYSRKIHRVQEVHGKDGGGATMDSMELERERGITIASAATQVEWKDHKINIIDTPGHVDFTIEVERALRVLDGAILVLCAVGGVQSQTLTVDRQLKRYQVPRIAFVNKCDRVGANPLKVKEQLRERLGHNAVMMQLPVGLEGEFKGIVDLAQMKTLYYEGPMNETVISADIPAELLDQAQAFREQLIDAASMFSDELAEAYLEGEATPEMIYTAVRRGTLSQELTPVFLGSAYRNMGVRALLDGAVHFLPAPGEVQNSALDLDKGEAQVELKPEPDQPVVALAFKLEDGQYGQLTYIRIYQGTIRKGEELYNSRSRQKFRIGRLVRMHADKMEEITEACCGDIVALFGIDCASGDTFTDKNLNYSMTSMFVPEPVISLAVKAKEKKSEDLMSKALNRFAKEDPTFRAHIDPESKQTIISGMGELHLDVYLERIRREYRAEVETGMPQVAYRETISRPADFDYTHKKQTGGAGQFARVAGRVEPNEIGGYEFVNQVKGGAIPTEYIPACDKGFRSCLEKGSVIGFPVVGVTVTINDGSAHAVDSSDLAFQQAAIGAFRSAYLKAAPEILEPIMKVSVEGPTEYQGGVFASINQRRGMIVSTNEDGNLSRIDAEVPLSEMFGYSTVLRSITQGKAQFTMEFSRYAKVPNSISESLKSEYQKVKSGENP